MVDLPSYRSLQYRPTKKNVILISVDCLRADHLSCYNYFRVTTPNIDKISKNGILFLNAVSNGQNTVTSFPAILTSTYALMHKRIWVPLLMDQHAEAYNYLSRGAVNIAEILKRAGYFTVAINSNPFLSKYFGYNKGFIIYEDFLGKQTERNVTNQFTRLIKPKIKKIVPLCIRNKILHMYSWIKQVYGLDPCPNARLIVRNALNLLKIIPRPFFIWIHFMDAHYPYIFSRNHRRIFCNVNSWDMSRANNIFMDMINPENVSKNELKTLIDMYDDEILYIDSAIGEFLNELELLDIGLDNTYFIIIADHGEEFKEHGKIGHGPYRTPGHLYDELIHIPFIICGPDIDGKIIENQVSLIDLAPTVIDLLGFPKIKSFYGASLLSLIREEKSNELRSSISEDLSSKYIVYSYRTEKWKYILTLNREKKTIKKRELYDLENDPKESENLSGNELHFEKTAYKAILHHMKMEERAFNLKNKIRLKIKKIRSRNEL